MDVTLEKTLIEKFGVPAGAVAGVLEVVRTDYRKELEQEMEQRLEQTLAQRLQQELERYRRELTEVEERYRRVLELSSSVIGIHMAGKLVFANAGAARMWGAKSPADMIGKDVFELLHPDSREKVRERIDKMTTLGVSVELIDENFQARDGTVFNMEVAAAPITYMGEPAIVVVAENVTLRKEMEQRLQQEMEQYRRELTEVEERYRRVLEISSSAIVIHRDGKVVFANDSAARIWGAKRPADMIGKDVFEFVHPDSREKARDRIEKMTALGVSVELIDEDFLARDGTVINMEVAAAPITYQGGAAIVLVAENVTLRKEMVELFQAMSNYSPSAIAIVQDQRICYVNRMFLEISGYSEDELLGKNSLSIILGADRPKVRRHSAKMLAGERTIPYEYRGVKKNGEIIWLMESMAPIKYRGKPAILANLIDITERKQMEEQVKNAVLYDRLTGHYNRVYFEEEMRRLEKSRPLPVSAVVCDIDGLKLVNDTMGYAAGDRLIKVAGALVSACTGGRHMVARMGAGEFNILLARTSAAAVEGFCEQLAGRIERHNVDNPELPLSMSIGMTTWGEAGSGRPDLTQVLKVAYSHMFRQKLLHRGSARSTIVEALMKTLAARDVITREHADRLLDLVLELARAVGLPNHSLADLSLLARFHDIGKVGVPDSILLKPGPLDAEEIAAMRRHTEIGCQIALAAPELVPVADLIAKHHEWWDGGGYHLGLTGEEIPVECRILAVVDAFDAMTSDRPYRQAMTETQAVDELRRCAGTQFDPRLVEEMVRILEARGRGKEGNGDR